MARWDAGAGNYGAMLEDTAELRHLCLRCVTAGRAARDGGSMRLRVTTVSPAVASVFCCTHTWHAMAWAAGMASFDAAVTACGRMAG